MQSRKRFTVNHLRNVVYQVGLKSKERYFKEKANGTTIPHLDQEAFFGEHFEILPYHLQLTINNYLDTQTQKINHFITKKQQFIALLKEQRQSVINEAVTKGLNYDSSDFYDENDLNAEKKNQKNHNNHKNQKNHSSDKRRMKDSGIKWLGNIPEHWKIMRLKNVSLAIKTGSTPKSEDEKIYFENGEINWFTPGDIKDFCISDSSRKITQKAIEDNVVELFKEKSLLVIGIGATLGRVSLIEKAGGSNQQINSITFNDEINPYFGLYFVSSFENILKQMSNASTLAILTQTKLKSFQIVIPPLSEQTQIVNHIKAETATIDTAIAKAEREIELIKEYKEAMIAEAVMGKVKMSEL